MNTASPTIEPTGSRKTSRYNAAPSDPSLHRYALFVACATFLLVIAGGLVTSTGSSLAVPDWPLSNGQFFPKMEGGVFYEHGHRMIAGTVGILTFILAGWIWRKDRRKGIRLLSLASAIAVVIQATLGGLTVLYRLPVPVSVAHACLGQIFFTMNVCIAILTSSSTTIQRTGPMTKLQRIGILTASFIVYQLIAGAAVRHTGRHLHWHFLGAALVAIHIPLFCRRVLKSYPLSMGLAKTAALLPLLLAIQIVLGYISWKTGPIFVTTAHVAIGALLLAGTVGITLQSFRQPEAA
jgi:cytochrome c oxidase assembly protein subunit 15